MNEPMRVLIAYDGSRYADDAIDDLRLAGLPPQGEALIVAAADAAESLSSAENLSDAGVLGKFVSTTLLEETIALTYKERERAREKATKLAVRGGKRIRAILPDWPVKTRVALGSPAEELLKKAEEFRPDLIVIGSHGRSALGRFFLGSVSQTVAEKAACSVRVGRRAAEKDADRPAWNTVIIGASSLPDAEDVIRAIGARRWSPDTELHVIVADDGISAGRVSAVYPFAKSVFEQSIEELRRTGARVSVDIKTGPTETVLLEEAENRKARSIFVANETESEETGLGALAANLLAHAECTIEIAR